MSTFTAIKIRKSCLRLFSTNMKKKVVVLTGCNTGLGFSLAQRCLREGAFVVAGCLHPEGEGAKQLQGLGAHIQPLDVTEATSVANAASCVAQILSDNDYQLQAVVNNAGVMIFGEFEWQTPKQISQQIAVNLLGSLTVAHHFLPFLSKDKGRLVNVVSHCAIAGLPGLSVYGATKAALLNWNDTLRIEQSKYGVKVISFIPGSFYGDSGIMAQQSQHAEEMLQNMSLEGHQRHEPYFTQVQQYLAQLPCPQGPKLLTDEALLKKMSHAVFAPEPRSAYKHEPMRYAIYHSMFKICPVWLRDRLVERFVSLPKYQ